MRAIGALPPQLSSQPPEMVMSMALQQLVLREAIVQEARSQGLAEDPEVQSLVEGATQSAEEDALVQVWLQREISGRVTPEAVEAAYAGLQAASGEEPVPPLDEIRAQIEQSLAQQAVSDLRGALLSNTQVTVYGPDGQPVEQQSDADGGEAGTGDQSGQAAPSGSDTAEGQAAAPTPQQGGGSQTSIMVAESQEHGQYLVDGEGRAFYGFTADERGQGDTRAAISNCYDACAEAWPPVLIQEVPTTGEMAMPNLLGATLRADGSMQVTYSGWPLYHFVQDQGPGQATGQDVQAHGGEWYLLRPTGELVDQE
jgi:predicted lipoprotein with Yx(FWY)xxD motif